MKKKELKKEKRIKCDRGQQFFSILENPGIDPGTSRMQSGRSTIWANSLDTIVMSENKTIKIYFYSKRQTLDLQ